MEWYYNYNNGGYHGIDYETVRVDKSIRLDTSQLDTIATIGVYLQRLDRFTRECLAHYFVLRLSDDASAKHMSKEMRKSITGHIVMRHRKKALRRLAQDFKDIGLIGDPLF